MKKGVTVGMDMGDKNHQVCVLDMEGAVVLTQNISNTAEAIKTFFKDYRGATVAIEAGTHSGWVSRILEGLGCEVLIGNPRKLKAIWSGSNKSDVRDAEMLARIARFDRSLLYPIHHRGESAQADLETIKARDMLVRNRSALVNHVCGVVKSFGGRIPSVSADAFHRRAASLIPEKLKDVLAPLLAMIEELTKRIHAYDKTIEDVSTRCYPETARLSQVAGVGPITSLAYVLTLEESDRFKKSRTVGAFMGLTPRRDQSGQSDKQLRISKAGNAYVRRLLVGSAQYILGPFGPDCDLRRCGCRIAERGGKNAKRRAVVGVARKLAVLLHRLWVSGETYEPIRSKAQRAEQEEAVKG